MRLQSYLLLWLPLILVSGRVAAVEPSYDFRIVIDVSNSMQQSDPQNLRIPALKLLNGLIPHGSHAGVWTYGRYVDVAVKWGKVDDRWRAQADIGAAQIHSNAELTNLASALARASVGWGSADPGTRRVLLLLTDGRVNMGKYPEKNARSRAKVLGSGLTALKKAGAEVHTIALLDATDAVLLKRLAFATNGSFTVANSAAELPKIFFKIFERIRQPDTVALTAREFSIDTNVKELTLLLFRPDGGQPTLLIPPNSPAISAQKPRAARWRSDQGYDLIRLANPEVGVWRIDAETDLDSRLMVVSDLSMRVTGIPPFGLPSERLQVAVELFERDKKISKNSVLRFVDFKLTHIDSDGKPTSYALTHSKIRRDKGQYVYSLEQKLAEGMHSFIVSVNGSNFNRSKRYDRLVEWPVEVRIEPQASAGIFEFMLRARQEYLKPEGLVADVSIEAPNGARETVELEARLGWLRSKLETSQTGTYRAHVKISAQTHAPTIRDVDLGEFSFLGVARAVSSAKNNTQRAAPKVTANNAKTVAEESIDWHLAGIVVVAVNFSLVAVGVIIWISVKRKQTTDDFALMDDDDDV